MNGRWASFFALLIASNAFHIWEYPVPKEEEE